MVGECKRMERGLNESTGALDAGIYSSKGGIMSGL